LKGMLLCLKIACNTESPYQIAKTGVKVAQNRYLQGCVCAI
jgi:hypothetical protein